jgi:hypothetical protein
MISICVATRARPEVFAIMCLTALTLASTPDDIEFVSYHDIDDKSQYTYFGNHQEIIGARTTGSEMYNECQAIAKGDIYMMIADDFRFETPGWDKVVKESFDLYPDKIVLVWPDDRLYRSRFAQSLFLHKNWVDTVGYFATPYFATQYLDSWWNDVSKMINRRHFMRYTIVKHYWVADDTTHIDYMKRSRGENARRRFSSEEMVIKRKEDAQKLQRFIDTYEQ